MALRFLLVFAVSFIAQAQEVLNNESIVKLVKAGMSDSVILTLVNQQPGNYALRVDDLTTLKQSGVSDKVVAAMIKKNGELALSPASVADSPFSIVGKYDNRSGRSDLLELGPDGTFSLLEAGVSVTGTYTLKGENLTLMIRGQAVKAGYRESKIVDPQGQVWSRQEASAATQGQTSSALSAVLEPPNDPGLYYYDSNKWVKLQRPTEKGKSGGIAKRALIGVGKIQMGFEFPGSRAQLQIADRRPIFYIRVDTSQLIMPDETRAVYAAWSFTTAGSAFIVRLNQNTKNGTRELISRTGTIDSDYRLRDHQVIKPIPSQIGATGLKMAVSLTTDEDLEPGQYVLSFGGELGTIHYDFDVVSK